MTFVKLVLIYDVIVWFSIGLYKLYLLGLSTGEKIKYKLSPPTKTCKILIWLMLLSFLLSFIAALTLLIIWLF